MAKVIKHVRVNWGAELNKDQYLLSMRLLFPLSPQKKFKYTDHQETRKDITRKIYKFRLLNYESIKWLHTKRVGTAL
jgi:hypothetical protein